jgi:hypothetical protein
MSNSSNKMFLVGDVRFTDESESIFISDESDTAIDFLLKLQDIMEEFGVVKIDVSIDAFKFLSIKNKSNNN